MSVWLQDTWEFLRHPLILPLVVTAVAGLLAYLTARGAVLISRLVSLLAAAAAFGLGLGLFVGDPVTIDVTWLEVSNFRLAVAMSNHTFGALIAMGAGFFGFLIALYAQAAERGRRYEGRFHAFLCWTLTGAFGAALADDLIWLLLCWELVSLCLYMLLNLERGDAPAGAMKAFGMIGFGDAAMLLAIALIGTTQGTFRLDELAIQVGTPLTYSCYLLFLVAALAKAGAIPMHSWIPTAARDASAATFALLPASLDKLLGVYLLVRFSLGVFTLDEAMKVVLMVLGALTVVAAALMAMQQTHWKRLVAFQAIGSTGYIVLGVGTGLPIGIAGAVFHALNGAVYQACLFLGGGIVERRTGTDDLDRLGGLARSLPGTWICCTIAALAISGVPPLNGFVSKWLVYQGVLGVSSPLAMVCLVAAVFGSALTLAASVKLLGSAFWGPATAERTPVAGRLNGKLGLVLPMVVLAVLCVGLGVAAQWPLQQLVLPAIADAGAGPLSLTVGPTGLEMSELGVWGPAPATMLILLGLFGGLVLYVIGRVGAVREARPFIGGEVLPPAAKTRFPATAFYRTIEELPTLGAGLRDGANGAFDVYRLGGRYGGTLVETLRRQHTGMLSLYVAWCLVGAVVIIAYLMTVN